MASRAPSGAMAGPTSHATAPHYSWGQGCDGWHLAKADGLSVIQERMPPGTSETRHYHERARQFFYVLRGTASFELEGRVHALGPGDGIEVPPLAPHTMVNRSPGDLEFLVVSAPPSHGDRVLAPAWPGAARRRTRDSGETG